MKILVVSEEFSRGGLETQIKTYYDNLPQGTEMIFAFSRYTEEVPLEKAKVYTGFHFSFNDTVTDFCEDVERLIKIISEEKIDVIHAHPFFSFFAVLFASQLTKTKMVYTYHGLGSFNFLNTSTLAVIFKYAFEIGVAAKLFSVNKRGMECFEKLGCKNCVFLPNPIDVNKYKKAAYINNKKWALVSRLDVDKVVEIKRFILNCSEYGIEAVDIYGAGGCVDELRTFIEEHQLSEKVRYLGYCSDFHGIVHKKYNGIVGIGRVVLEGLAMGMPVFVIGYGKFSGFVNTALYNALRGNNFSNYAVNDQNFEPVNDIEIEAIRQHVYENMSMSAVINKYLDSLNQAESTYLENLVKLYDEIKALARNEATSNIFFTTSREVYMLTRRYIGGYTSDNAINNMFINTDLSYIQSDELARRIENQNQQIIACSQENQNLKNQNEQIIAFLQENEILKNQIIALENQLEECKFEIDKNKQQQKTTETTLNGLSTQILVLQNAENRRAGRIYRRVYRKIKGILKPKK